MLHAESQPRYRGSEIGGYRSASRGSVAAQVLLTELISTELAEATPPRIEEQDAAEVAHLLLRFLIL
jgi:hypothetical protein